MKKNILFYLLTPAIAVLIYIFFYSASLSTGNIKLLLAIVIAIIVMALFFMSLKLAPQNLPIKSKEHESAISLQLKAADEQKNLFASIVNSSDDAIISKTLDGIITSWNKGAETIFGYTEAEMIGKSIYTIIPQELKHEEADIIAKIKSGKFIKHYETERVDKNGRRLAISLTVSPVFDSAGKIAGVSKIGRDVTEKKKTENAIQHINNEKNAILESIDDAFIAVDKNWAVTYWNSRAEIMLQVNKTDIMGHNLWEKFPDSVGNEAYKKYHEAVETHEAVHLESYNAKLNKWYEISAYPSASGLSVYFKDITERKLSELRLKEVNETLQKQTQQLSRSNKELEQLALQLSATVKEVADYKLALDQTSIVAITDQKGIIKYVNENFCKISKYTNYELLGQDHRIINSAYHTKEFIRNLWVTIANGNIWKGELKNKAKDGTFYWVDTTIVPFLDNSGKPYQYVAIRLDITERKNTEVYLTELNNNLQTQAKELARSNAELEQFAYVASHDMQEPLRMVSSFLSQLEKKYADVIDEKGKTYIGFAVDGAKRMRQIILDLLEFSKIGKTEDKKENLDLSNLISDIKILFRKQVEEKKAVIETFDLPVIHTYKIPVYQVFQNLISNSLKYAAADKPCKIEISASDLTTHWQFAVADNGIGINEEFYDKIFVIFQRLHNKDDYSGTGMGLAIAKKIIDNLGGKIWVKSQEGKGSTFYFTIEK